ncbi:Cysteine-rich receptor-like protein kinase 6 isoform 2 [Zea mays]|uniref:Gnk2-homologous domain-containing protein n=1 Tax=Zea mays TaxID=4577 RepID=B4FJJ3_MAIZE|nr:Cysteine-rich receptor-like protein kinase 6 isoform 2 [Zea mays]ACF82286.1 unknown [Zea mays]|eukprot:NP_001136622.1 uncharacterized protein LOC100216747 isoform 2 [Zea mays]
MCSASIFLPRCPNTMFQKNLLPLAAVLAVVASLMAAAAGYPWSVCGDSTDSSDFMPNGRYQAHLDFIAAALPKNASKSPYLFATVVAGTVPDQVWAVGLCRGDAKPTACFTCLTLAFQDLPGYCTYAKDASIYYDRCMVHYSDVHTLSGDDDTGPMMDRYAIGDTQTIASDPGRFVLLVAALVNATADYAAYGSGSAARRGFATGEADAGFDPEFPKLYALAQCMPGQTPALCRECLSRLISQSLDGFRNSIGGRVLAVSCTYRYESAPFYDGPAMVRLAPPSSGAPAPAPAVNFRVPAADGRKYHVPWVALAVVLPALAALNLVACLCLRFRRRRRRQPTAPRDKQQKDPVHSTEAEDIEMVESMMMDVSTLRAATGDFDESNKLGEGGFGAVYKVRSAY